MQPSRASNWFEFNDAHVKDLGVDGASIVLGNVEAAPVTDVSMIPETLQDGEVPVPTVAKALASAEASQPENSTTTAVPAVTGSLQSVLPHSRFHSDRAAVAFESQRMG